MVHDHTVHKEVINASELEMESEKDDQLFLPAHFRLLVAKIKL